MAQVQGCHCYKTRCTGSLVLGHGPALPTDPYPIRIPGYVPLGHGKMEAVETPAQLMYLADQLRTGEVSMDMDQMEPNDVVRLYWEFAEEKKKQPKKQSTFGPGGFIVRD